VGDDYYIVNSSFQYFPGVPIYHSKDLVNWELIGNILDRGSQLELMPGATSWQGIYAPTIRYHNGTFYMITTNIGGKGNFIVTAKDPKGPWSDPIWLEQQGIDPSLLFEGNKCYMLSNPDNTISLCEIDPATGKQLTPSKALWKGTGGRYPEGPHIYKKDGWYYLLISEGGTEIAHRLTIARSRNIYGPYESNPKNPILTHCNIQGQNSQIQATGHGDFVQAKDGSWWITFLAYRNFGGSYHHLGRETYLAPVEWKKGQWPVINGGMPIDTLMNLKPVGMAQKSQKRHIHTTFDNPLGPEWIYVQNPDSAKYKVCENWLHLYSSSGSLTKNQRPSFIGRRQESASMSVTTLLDFNEGLPRDEAGLTAYQMNDGHAEICLKPSNGKTQVMVKYQLKTVSAVLGSAQIDGYRAYLRIRSDGDLYYFEYATDGKNFKSVATIDCELLSTEVVGGFTGVVLGMYATGADVSDAYGDSFAMFNFFDYEEF